MCLQLRWINLHSQSLAKKKEYIYYAPIWQLTYNINIFFQIIYNHKENAFFKAGLLLLIQIYTNWSTWARYDTRSFFKQSLMGLKSDSYSRQVAMPRLKSPVYFTESWNENSWIHTFPKGISATWNTILSRIWTQIAMSISNDDNHYTTSTFFYVHTYAYFHILTSILLFVFCFFFIFEYLVYFHLITWIYTTLYY